MPHAFPRAALILLLAAGLPVGVARAQSPPAPQPAEDPQKAQEERLRKLEEEVQALKAAQAAPRAEAPPLGGAGGSAAKALNPDISLNGDFRGSVGRNDVRPVPGLEMHEAELGLQSVIDPYSRGDVFLSFGDGGVSVEEAFVTLTALPGEFVARVGKLRAAFGKVNATHNHALPWTDRPLVTENLVNGEDGISDMGLSVSRILPAPGDLFLEATAQVFRGDSGDLFKSSRKNDLSFVGHLRGYEDLTENTNLELGYSYAQGHNDLGHDFLTKLHGVDVSLRWKPLRRSIYNSLLWRTELVWSRRDQLPVQQRAFGFYSSLEYRLDQRWTLGGRYDWSERAAQSSQLDRGASALLTYWMSEFSQVRGQYRFTRYDGHQDASELRLQLVFVLGAHGAHPF
ncbi:MAG: TonB-dependent receptor [Geothrix sp.]|uniref:TonB-dependent receptor n=1 Tax=Geothrix sp. TaxID=1962974 RepID=UPI0017EFC990|nr:TonB-dependent receptor [Geothrix sp.]NWJ42218.1 TonB-dependent receptor [Geothrix sp.]WIL19819.1 MAG: OprO/OprP family phosphate-selective porin [Geothrix sp.]